MLCSTAPTTGEHQSGKTSTTPGFTWGPVSGEPCCGRSSCLRWDSARRVGWQGVLEADVRLRELNGSDVMHTKVRVAAIVVLLLALGLFAITEWLPALLFLPAAGGALLLNETGMLTPGRPRNDRDRPRS